LDGHPKTAYILLWFPEPTETFIFRETNYLARLGLSLKVYTLYGPARHLLSMPLPSEAPPVERLGLRSLPTLLFSLASAIVNEPSRSFRLLHRVCFRRWGGLIRAGENLWAALCGFHLARLFVNEGVRHIHAPWAGGAATAAWVASERTGIPFSFTARARDIYLPDGALSDKVRRASFVRVNTTRNVEYMKRFSTDGAATIECVYNGVDADVGKEAPVTMEPPYRLLAVGRLVGKKGYEHLLRAAREMTDAGVDHRITIAGDGPLSASLRRLAKQLGLEERILFPGFVPYDQLDALFSEADIFLVPSVIDSSGDRDGIPNVIMEALLRRLPVIATDVSGIGELVVDGETGLLVPPGDPRALADAVLRLTGDRAGALRMAARGRQRVLSEFDPETNFRRILALIDANTSEAS
jgi:glycosyltransferase involved in cell wall biosynthesis